MRTDAMAELGPTEAVPGKDVADDNLEAAIRANARPGYQHVVGTCAMMPEEWGGVVDAALKVYGVGKLRVVDASMMPVIPGAHTSSTVYAVAEKVGFGTLAWFGRTCGTEGERRCLKLSADSEFVGCGHHKEGPWVVG